MKSSTTRRRRWQQQGATIDDRYANQLMVCSRGGFTLVEVLTVIVIIAILVGLLVPAINMARRSILQRSIALETQGLATAIEKYRQKYNDYPPDGSNRDVLVAHLRKIFPQIAASELALFGQANPATSSPIANCTTLAPNGVMDPPEALVFFLGGFSSDPVYPLSGVGGPFFIIDNNGNQVTSAAPYNTWVSVQYNPDRNEPLYDFNLGQLTVDNSSGITISTDESQFGLGSNDCLPVYRPSRREAPFVYFDSRTYSYPVGGSGRFYNFYGSYGSTNAPFGVVRPYRSDQQRTNVPANDYERRFRYMEENTYQLISAGLDDIFGGIITATGAGGPIFYTYPSGTSIDFGPIPSNPPVVGQFTGYQDGSGVATQLDNVANFSEGTFGDALPN